MHQSIDWCGVLLSLTDSLWHTCKNRWMTPWVHWPKSQEHRKLSMRSLFSDGCMPSSYLDPLHPVLKYSQGSIKVTRFLLVARGPMDIRDTDPKVKNIINCQWGPLDQCCLRTGLVQNYWRMLCAFS